MNGGNGCFCDIWGNSGTAVPNGDFRGGAYTDQDLAVDMNAMSFAERAAMEEDIHGVADVIEEEPEFVMKKIQAMQEALGRLDSKRLLAWDRAVFLRPGLADDRRFHLIFFTCTSIPTCRCSCFDGSILIS